MKTKKTQLPSNFYQLSQQLVKEIRQPACWLCCILMAESWQGGHSLSGFCNMNISISGIFSDFCYHTIQDFQFTYKHMHVHADVSVHVAMCVCIKAFFWSFFAYRNRNPWLFEKLQKTRSPVLPSSLFVCCIKWEVIKQENRINPNKQNLLPGSLILWGLQS